MQKPMIRFNSAINEFELWDKGTFVYSHRDGGMVYQMRKQLLKQRSFHVRKAS